jgi:hypothetical protein
MTLIEFGILYVITVVNLVVGIYLSYKRGYAQGRLDELKHPGEWK